MPGEPQANIGSLVVSGSGWWFFKRRKELGGLRGDEGDPQTFGPLSWPRA